MSNVSRFFSLTPIDQRRLVYAFLIVAAVRIGLSVISFPHFQAILARFTKSSQRNRNAAPTTAQLVQDIRAVSGFVPHSTCLTQALAGQILLAHYGYSATVHVGVAKSDDDVKAFEAHAWLESGGRVVIGQSEQQYVLLTTLGDTTSV